MSFLIGSRTRSSRNGASSHGCAPNAIQAPAADVATTAALLRHPVGAITGASASTTIANASPIRRGLSSRSHDAQITNAGKAQAATFLPTSCRLRVACTESNGEVVAAPHDGEGDPAGREP